MIDSKKRRARAGGKDKGRCQGRVTEREMRWIIVERPSWDVDLDETWWDWLPEFFFGLSVIGLDAGSCGVGLSWGSVRRPGNSD